MEGGGSGGGGVRQSAGGYAAALVSSNKAVSDIVSLDKNLSLLSIRCTRATADRC
jgi:hypothetical protein